MGNGAEFTGSGEFESSAKDERVLNKAHVGVACIVSEA